MKKLLSCIGLLSFVQTVSASSLLVDKVPYDYVMPKSIAAVCGAQNNCPEVSISYLYSNSTKVNNVVNKSLLDSFALGGERAYKNNQEPHSAGVQIDVAAVKHSVEAMGIDGAYRQDSPGIVISSDPQYMGHVGIVEQFSFSTYTYLGGAHGVSGYKYVMFDNALQRQIGLDDLIVQGQRDALNALANQAFDEYLQSSGLSRDDLLSPFVVTDNVGFTVQGLNFVYQPYEIMAYAMGMPEFTIPYTKLRGVIKPAYLADMVAE